jgi:intracellular multiplication protein IcmP
MGSQQTNPDNMGFLYVSMILTAAVILLWFFGRAFVVQPVIWLRIQECHVASFFCSVLDPVTSIFGWHIKHYATEINSYITQLSYYSVQANADKIKLSEFSALNFKVGGIVRYPVIASLLIMCAMVYSLSKSSRYKQTHSMKTLKNLEASNWPQITPVLGVDLVKANLNEGPWAMAQSPLAFCHHHKLIFAQEKEGYRVWGLHRDPAMRVLSMQVGRQLIRIEQLPIHAKGLLVIFAARATRKREISDHFIEQFAASSKPSAKYKINTAGVEEAFNKLKNERCIQWTMQRHAYEYTFMATMLEIARSDGVLASSEFLWLKPLDRGLWYMMNAVGRQTALVEIAGGVGHWLAEKKIGRRLKTPMIKEAVNALENAVENILCEEEGDSWRSKGA